ncbi:MAG TPA: hypothetical protein VE011_10960 [Candidatus Dormibacteraeota bacterium]|nr:hypothetical protein [Candidatus Dormibacteraeota bacterium]
MIAAAAAIEPPAAGYRLSAVSRFLSWADDLPWHGALLYLAMAALLFAWGQAVAWATGLVPVGTFHPLLATGFVYGPYILAALAYLNRVAVRALAQFWPATGWPDDQQATWRYAFVTAPGGYGAIAFGFGLAAAIGAFFSASDTLIGTGSDRLILLVGYLPAATLGYSLVVVAISQSVRQLRLVARIHREATRIDPFDRVPLYAFSGLTVRTALTYLVSGYYALTVNGTFQAGNVVGIVVLAATFGAGIACFVLPLWGIHERLVHEKAQLLQEVERRLGRLGDEMYRRIDGGQFDGTKVVSDALSGVQALRDRISRLPTWPWQPNLFRGFLSALLLPVIVYVVSRLIGGRVGV